MMHFSLQDFFFFFLHMIYFQILLFHEGCGLIPYVINAVKLNKFMFRLLSTHRENKNKSCFINRDPFTLQKEEL